MLSINQDDNKSYQTIQIALSSLTENMLRDFLVKMAALIELRHHSKSKEFRYLNILAKMLSSQHVSAMVLLLFYILHAIFCQINQYSNIHL